MNAAAIITIQVSCKILSTVNTEYFPPFSVKKDFVFLLLMTGAQCIGPVARSGRLAADMCCSFFDSQYKFLNIWFLFGWMRSDFIESQYFYSCHLSTWENFKCQQNIRYSKKLKKSVDCQELWTFFCECPVLVMDESSLSSCGNYS